MLGLWCMELSYQHILGASMRKDRAVERVRQLLEMLESYPDVLTVEMGNIRISKQLPGEPRDAVGFEFSNTTPEYEEG